MDLPIRRLATFICALAMQMGSSAATRPICLHAPAIPRNFPDPEIVAERGRYYAYATNSLRPEGQGANVQIAISRNLIEWSEVPGVADALPHLPSWARRGWTWAPAVAARPDSRGFVMYFTAREANGQRQCIGVATSPQPDGPFTAQSGRPLVCPSPFGAIDASTYRERGHLYLLWKIDGNCCEGTTRVYLRELTSDGLRFRRSPKSTLIDHDLPWEGRLTEAPVLWRAAGRYWLFYSANNWDRPADGGRSPYATSYASSVNFRGPYRKSGAPLLGQGADGRGMNGPGGPTLFRGPGDEILLAYHAWTSTGRAMFIDAIDWRSGLPRVTARCSQQEISKKVSVDLAN